jgi:hypothetical protein
LIAHYNNNINQPNRRRNKMTIEQSLAARKIAEMIRAGYSKQAAITQAAKLVKSQGFGAEHAKKTAQQMAELV